jgi:hypothetical protein
MPEIKSFGTLFLINTGRIKETLADAMLGYLFFACGYS